MKETTHLEGVYIATKKSGETYYRSSLTFRRKHISLGSFSDAEAANQAYKTASEIITNTNINIIDYDASKVLPFEKWVILINYRDNHIYLGHPIYVRPKFFYYYLSPDQVFKFDSDDLFYYSSHKIMARGNHYFVADYGMQVSILSRYGIKSYAVPGVDYEFLNGDTTDFRRENLSIKNTYHGVRCITYRGITKYHVRIHINGYYHVGTYQDMLHAAIAYNKAVDVLHQHGLTKNFIPNYIDSISPREYAEIYSQIKISPKIMEYKPVSPKIIEFKPISPNNQSD